MEQEQAPKGKTKQKSKPETLKTPHGRDARSTPVAGSSTAVAGGIETDECICLDNAKLPESMRAKRIILASTRELEAVRSNPGSGLDTILNSSSPSNANSVLQAKVTINKALKQAFNMTGLSQSQSISPSACDQMDKNREAVLKIAEMLCSAKTLDQESAELTLEQCLENVGNTSFASAQIQTEQGTTDYDKRLAATHALIVKLFKRYQRWCNNTTDPAFVALPRYYVQQRYSRDLTGRRTENLTDYFQQWLTEENKPSLVVFGDAGGGKSLLTLDWEEKLWARVPAVRWINVSEDQVVVNDSSTTNHALVVWYNEKQWLLTYRSGEYILELNLTDLKGYGFAQILAQESYESLCTDKDRLAEVTIGLQCYWLLKQKARIPLRIPLGDYTSKTVPNCIKLHLQKRLSIDEDAIDLLKSHVPFLFLLDGYDEIKIEKGLFRDNLYRSNDLSSWSAKVLFTCRSQYFNSPGAGRSCFNVAITADEHKVYLAQFKSSDIEAYVDRYAAVPENEVENKQEILASITGHKTLTELLATPLLLNLYMRSYVGGAQSPETRWALYNHLMSQLFMRQAIKQLERQPSTQAELEELAQDYDDASAELAFTLIEQNKEVFSKAPRRNRRRRQALESETESPLVSFFTGEDPVHDELRRGHPFKRTSDGSYGFIHESFKEYFMAKYLLFDLKNIINSPKQASQTWNTILLPEKPVILKFLKEAIDSKPQEKQSDLTSFLNGWVGLKEREQANVSANAASLLVRLGHSFSNQNLSGTYLMGANLSGGMFDSTNFTAAGCSGVNFSQAWLRRANFTRADLSDTEWGEHPKLELEGQVKAMYSDATGIIQIATVAGKKIYLWCGATGKRLATLRGHTRSIYCLSYRADGLQLASGSSDCTLRLWNVAGRCLEATLEGHNYYIRCLSYSADGLQLASGGYRTIRLWNVAGRCQEAMLEGHINMVLCLSYRADGLQLASGGEDSTIRLWNVARRCLETTLEEHTDWVSCLSYRADGLQLASGSFDSTIRLWNLARRCQEATLEGHTSDVSCLSYNADGLQLASGGEDSTIRLWNVARRCQEATLEGHTDSVRCLGYSADGFQLASGGSDSTIRLWNVARRCNEATLEGHTEHITCLSYSADGFQLASGSYDSTIHLWNIVGRCLEASLMGHTEYITCLSYSADGFQLASGSSDSTIRLWNVSRLCPEATLEGHTRSVKCLSYSADGYQLASGSDDRTIRLWSVARRCPEATLEGHTSYDSCLSYSADGYQLASGSDRTIHLWNVTRQCHEAMLEGHTRLVTCLSYSADGLQLASGSEDRTIRLWNVARRCHEATLEGHTEYITCLSYSADGLQLASGSEDRTLRIWDPNKYVCLRILSLHLPIAALAWHEKFLALGCGKEIVQFQTPQSSKPEAWYATWRAALNPIIYCKDLNISGAVCDSICARLLTQYGAVGEAEGSVDSSPEASSSSATSNRL
jgi:WD40 repeat protein